MVPETGLGPLRYMHPLWLIDGNEVRGNLKRRPLGTLSPDLQSLYLLLDPCLAPLLIPCIIEDIGYTLARSFLHGLNRLDMILEHRWRRMPLSGMEPKHPVREAIGMRAWLEVR